MKSLLIFIGGFVAGILATLLFAYITSSANRPNDGLIGLSKFPQKGDCVMTTSKHKSRELEVLQVIAPNAALAYMKYYTDEKQYGGRIYRNYDIENEVIVLLINYDNRTYYDKQKFDITNKCAREIGTYQYTTKVDKFEKTVPAVVIE
jgi:hypothetical protein